MMDWELGYTPNNLRLLMEKHSMTAKAVADITDVGIRQVRYWLAGGKDMPLYRWNKLLKCVGVPLTRYPSPP